MGLEPPRLSRFFAVVLQRHRESQKLSRQGLAERAGLHQTAVGLIERSLRSPNIDTLHALAKALQIDAWRLLQEAEGEMRTAPPSARPSKIRQADGKKVAPKRGKS